IPQEAAQNVATLPAAAATAVSSAAESEPAAAKPGLCNLALLPFLAIGLIFVQKRSRKQ
ncbi:MAG: hypothetical protein GY796_28475, partial [Chloroflexi bacterium]|nr:hypothetical protein [Chloroflexota bacterium]